MVKVLDCGFEVMRVRILVLLCSLSNKHPLVRCEPFYSSSYWLDSRVLFLYKEGFGFKQSKKVDMLLNEQRDIFVEQMTFCINVDPKQNYHSVVHWRANFQCCSDDISL